MQSEPVTCQAIFDRTTRITIDNKVQTIAFASRLNTAP